MFFIFGIPLMQLKMGLTHYLRNCRLKQFASIKMMNEALKYNHCSYAQGWNCTFLPKGGFNQYTAHASISKIAFQHLIASHNLSNGVTSDILLRVIPVLWLMLLNDVSGVIHWSLSLATSAYFLLAKSSPYFNALSRSFLCYGSFLNICIICFNYFAAGCLGS